MQLDDYKNRGNHAAWFISPYVHDMRSAIMKFTISPECTGARFAECTGQGLRSAGARYAECGGKVCGVRGARYAGGTGARYAECTGGNVCGGQGLRSARGARYAECGVYETLGHEY